MCPPLGLTTLPTEVLQHIFTFCSLTTHFSIRHTSKSMYGLTKLSDGERDLIDMSPAQCTRHERGTALASIEAAWPSTYGPLHGLTCSNCARIKYNNTTGFADDEYQQRFVYRMCIRCKMQEHALLQIRQKTFTVKGLPVFACSTCGQAKKVEEEAVTGIFPAMWVRLQRGSVCGSARRRCRVCFLKVSQLRRGKPTWFLILIGYRLAW